MSKAKKKSETKGVDPKARERKFEQAVREAVTDCGLNESIVRTWETNTILAVVRRYKKKQKNRELDELIKHGSTFAE